MPREIDVTIEPNEKYRYAVDMYQAEPGDETLDDLPDHDEVDEETRQAADGYIETVENAPTPDNYDVEPEETPLSWDDFSPASDPDLVAKIATYFDGMDPDEPTDRLRAKCRLLDPEVYVNAQIAARAELRGT